MNRFKHSGAFGDLIYSLALTKYLGGGEYYLHLNQINWIGQHYYGSAPNPFHQGRMTEQDFEFMRLFMQDQNYITKFALLEPKIEVTHNLDRFRSLFVGHPGNYVDIYCKTFNVQDQMIMDQIRNTPWITVKQATVIKDRPVVINRTARWQPNQLPDLWLQWKKMGMEHKAMFVGLPQEYEAFKKSVNWNIPYHETNNMLELAEVIAGSEIFIGNQSMALALAIGLGVNVCCEHRTDLPLARNECFGFDPVKVRYFS
jgi:hypothetical protein